MSDGQRIVLAGAGDWEVVFLSSSVPQLWTRRMKLGVPTGDVRWCIFHSISQPCLIWIPPSPAAFLRWRIHSAFAPGGLTPSWGVIELHYQTLRLLWPISALIQTQVCVPSPSLAHTDHDFLRCMHSKTAQVYLQYLFIRSCMLVIPGSRRKLIFCACDASSSFILRCPIYIFFF